MTNTVPIIKTVAPTQVHKLGIPVVPKIHPIKEPTSGSNNYATLTMIGGNHRSTALIPAWPTIPGKTARYTTYPYP